VTQNLQKNFQDEYKKLNPEQKLAVDTIEGPVMVIAGAGTGKTQTIALRIANILTQTQTPPQNILCLTFTDTGTIAMRERLIKIIGSEAYKVRIHTFHSFCNEVIKNNPEYFIFAKNVKNIEEIEKVELIQKLISSLKNGSVLKPWGDSFFYQRDIISSIQSLKKEGVSPENLLTLINNQINFLTKNKDLISKLLAIKFNKNMASEVLPVFEEILTNSQKDSKEIYAHFLSLKVLYENGGFEVGAAKNPIVNFKNELKNFFESLDKDSQKQLELHSIYSKYQEELKSSGLYDFEDMILFVLTAFKKSPELLLEYQEKYQYILVDEYQDTNSAQNEIIDLLGSYYEIPNIFVVGDDDQSIFRFQGASIENVYSFYKKYNPLLVVLKNNYRSHRLILASSECVIKNNKNRITNFIDKIDKSLESKVDFDATPINLFRSPSLDEENYFIATKIKSLLDQKVDPQEIAVLYRNNNDVFDLVEHLQNLNIKYQLNLDKNILDNKYISQLTFLLEFIVNSEKSDLLYKVLASNYQKIPSFDLFKLTHFAFREKINLVSLIFSPQNFSKIENDLSKIGVKRIKKFVKRITLAKKWLENLSADRFFNKVIRRFKYLQFILTSNNLELINFLNAFYSEFKRLALEKEYSLHDFLNYLSLIKENDLSLTAPEISGESVKSVKLMTVHKSKGLEFEHVFLYKCADKKWGNTTNQNKLKLPLGILKLQSPLLENERSSEDERRLFYVALTRAKKQIYISYSVKSESGRDQLPSMFISEIDPEIIEEVVDSNINSESALKNIFPKTLAKLDVKSDFQEYLVDYLKNKYKFNITHLNSYLRCPFCFYHKTILKIPGVRDKHSSLGSAVHDALSFLLDTLRLENRLITSEELISRFSEFIKKEKLPKDDESESLKKGEEILNEYYLNYQSSFDKNNLTDFDFAPNHVYLDQIPITGKIDEIKILDQKINGKPVAEVIDFKTGNPDGKYKELSKDGDYFRQLVFYKILSDLDLTFKYTINKGTIDFVQKSKTRNKFIQNSFEFSQTDIDNLKDLIKEIYQKIINLEFNQIGEDCKDRDHLHSLLK
jgi:DNA helicase-2/ATP-dependent DNA helicase PcrA